MSLLGRRELKHSVSLRWWLVGAGVLAVVPAAALALALLHGGRGRRGEFSLPDPVAAEISVRTPQPAATAEDVGGPDEPLSSPWDAPERLEDAVEFLLARGDREAAMRLLDRMAPESEIYEQALTQLNRRFVDAWHAALAAAAEACLAGDQTLEPPARQGLSACAVACTPGRNRPVSLPPAVGGTRAVLLGMQARDEFLRSIDDCPQAYLDVLVGRALRAFPGASAVVGERRVSPDWSSTPRASLVFHLRVRLLLPVLCERAGTLRDAGRRSAALEDWLGGVAADRKRWHEFLAGPGGEAECRAALALLPAVVRRSWQRGACTALLARPGVRELVAAEDLLGSVWPGEPSVAEVAELAGLVVSSPGWQDALRVFDYASAEVAGGDAVALLLGNTRTDVAGHLRAMVAEERTALSAKPFPWYRVMRSLKVRDTPLFWQGYASLGAGELAHLQSGTNRIRDVSAADVYECMLRHAKRLSDARERKSAMDGIRAYARNRGVIPKRTRN